MLIYKILRADEWADLETHGSTSGAPVDLADGYIHFSTGDQVAETLARHFSGEQGLFILACSATDMGENLRWEPSRGGVNFPHLYRRLHTTDVLWHRVLPLDGDIHVLPEDLA